MPDDKAQARTIHQRYSGNPIGLAQYLILISLTQPGVVYEVFVLLDDYSTLDVGCQFLDSCDINALARTRKGLILCTALHRWLTTIRLRNPFRVPPSCIANNTKLFQLKAAIDIANPQDLQTSEPRQLSQMEMDWYANYNSSPIALKFKQGPRNNFNPDVCWQLPKSGVGFVVYNRDDFKNDSSYKKYEDTVYGYDQIGTKETIEAMIRIAKEWNAIHPDRLLQYGDISRPGGVNTPDHATHNNGKVFDIRPLRNDSQIGNAAKLTYTSPGYHRDLTKEFIRLVLRLFPGTTFHFNDAEIYKDKEFIGIVTRAGGHDNHVHVKFPGGN